MKPPEEKPTTLQQLQSATLAQLELLYATSRATSPPQGLYQGHFLCFSETKTSPFLRYLLDLGFRQTPFGIDFERAAWFFFRPTWRIGRFETKHKTSRWRENTTTQLHYQRSSLPTLIRRRLYDEVLVLSEDLCLGLGGINAERGVGDLFFFALERLEDAAPERSSRWEK